MIEELTCILLMVIIYQIGKRNGRVEFGKRFENVVKDLKSDEIVKTVKEKYGRRTQ